MKKLFLLILFMCFLLFSKAPDEYTIKAVYLKKFASFVSWPKEAMEKEKFRIGVVGNDPFEGKLQDIYKTHKILEKSVEIDYIKEIKSLDYHILFISKSEKRNIDSIIEKVKNSYILTISDTKDFSKHGVIINMINTPKGIDFVVNKNYEEQSKISLSIRFMKYARVIK
ncbi:MAG: hypothetical protein CR982_06870 [Candidatus Cloacimonadota bacterium]|nr:MAG: hypothetical protein CR982_06870 [Candidatus Cloacimonadota bacterium]PIE77794.1 MAG: hypothetical protein CSA15_10895 [Candidatus Delongbacteria bacterium]